MQVGDPFTEKLLIEACLEIFREDLVTGIQDLGGAGLSCATSELASAGTGGMHVDLDVVPLRDPTLTAAEILMSESQERMCAIVEPAQVDRFLEVCRKWDVLATVIGEVTDGDRLTVDWHGQRIVDVPPRTVAHEGPVYERPMARPADLDALQADDPARLPRPAGGAELQAHWLAVQDHPSDKASVDFHVQVPLGYRVIANGSLQKVDTLPYGHAVWTNERSEPIGYPASRPWDLRTMARGGGQHVPRPRF